MICPNCGFKNEPGDEFCGSCGKYLEFSATPTDDVSAGFGGSGQTGSGAGAGAAVGGAGVAAGATGGSAASGQAGASAAGTTGADDPTTVYPRPDSGAAGAGAAGAGASGTSAIGVSSSSGGAPGGGGGWSGGGGQPGPAGRSPDIICWNCGRRNPASRTFCINCGQKLTTPDGAGAGYGSAGAAAGGAGGGYAGSRGRARDDDTGGGGGRTAAIILGALGLLFIIGVIGALALGLFGSRPPGPVAVITPAPGSGSLASPTLFSGTPGPSGTLAFPSVEVTAPIFTVVPTLPPTPPPTRTPRPTCDLTGAPRGCRPSPSPEPATPTPVPTPVDCATATGVPKTFVFTVDAPTRPVPDNRVWCIRDVTFTNTSLVGATGTLKLFLTNPDFIGPPGNYGTDTIGWPGPCEASIEVNFSGSSEYHPTCEYPFGYEAMPNSTVVTFQIVNCGTNGTCGGSATVEFETIIAPPPP